ncbi:hypothetical protein BDV97DRAFT_394178 [Delphinella strobiligena]|nr:hypothetical protein BDV97DRAFT_394178 [Delphinella strobiligena]
MPPVLGEFVWKSSAALYEALHNTPMTYCLTASDYVASIWTGPPEQLDIDIGGNVGHDLIAFEQAVHRSYPGKVVLQDIPQVVKNAQLLPFSKIEVLSYDFFRLEYIEGGKAYRLHMVLHDWPDDKCREILQNIIPP